MTTTPAVPNVTHATHDKQPDASSGHPEPQTEDQNQNQNKINSTTAADIREAQNEPQIQSQNKINYRSHQRITIKWWAPGADGARRDNARRPHGGRVGLALRRTCQRRHAARRGSSC